MAKQLQRGRLVIFGTTLVFIIALYVTFIFLRNYKADFSTLSRAVEFATNMPEHPEIDNKDWNKPDYFYFFQNNQPSIVSKIAYRLGIARPYWSARSFSALLDDVTRQRTKRGYTGKFVQKILHTPDTKLIVWGNLQGAFHSLVRDLQELKQQGIIDDKLTILDPNYYFVFDGNVISRSPYSLETLTLVLRLIQVNPDQVIYVAGTHEDELRWLDFDMADALKVRLWYEIELNNIPRAWQVNAFFKTLPLALYMIGEEKPDLVEVVRVSNESTHALINDNELGSFLTKESPQRIFYLKDKKPAAKPVEVRVKIICNHYKTNSYLTQGLRLLLPEEKSTVWAILSAPTNSYKQRFNFENDAFTILETAQTFNQWTITLCKQNAAEKSGFDCAETLNLLNGFLSPLPFELKGEVVIGSTMDLSMGESQTADYLVEGLQAKFIDQNKKGGIKGNTIRLIVKDDQYNPIKTRTNIEEFINNGIDIIILPMGTQNLEEYKDLIEQKKVLVLFPSGGNGAKYEYLIFFGPGYDEEASVITQYALDVLKTQKIAFFFPDDQFGTDAMNGAKRILEQRDFKEYRELEYRRNTLEFTEQVKELIDYNPDTLALFATPHSAQEIILQLGVNNLAGDSMVGLSDISTNRFMRFLAGKGLNIVLVSRVPNPGYIPAASLLKEYTKSMRANKFDINTDTLTGYISATIFIEALKMIDGPVNKEKIVKAIQSMKNLDLDGIYLNYDPQDQQLSHSLWVARLPEQEKSAWQKVDLEGK